MGIRDRYDYTAGVLSNSLFSIYLQRNGLNVWKGESTRDLICLDFDFGSRSYEEEISHLERMLENAEDEHARDRVLSIIENVKKNKYKYKKMSKEDIRKQFYQNGVSVTYTQKDKKGEIINTETIHYVMLYRNSSKAKLGQVMFINEALYDTAYDWLTMGLGNRMPYNDAKIVELSAYAPLTTSTIVQTMHIPVEDILILKDQDSFFRTTANVVRAEDYDCVERVLDNDKTEKNRRSAIEKNKFDLWGNPIYKQVYSKKSGTKKKCVVSLETVDVKNTLWDGMGIIEDSILPGSINGMALLRNHFFKMCGFRGKIQQFFKDWCTSTGNDYDTYEVLDIFGTSHRLKDIKIITTENAVKWGKFADLMGDSDLAAYRYWCDRVNADGSVFGVVKTDHSSKLGTVQQMSYQMINTLPCSKYDIKDIAQNSIDYVELLKADNDEFEKFLRKKANKVNHYEMMADLYAHNHKFADSKWFRQEKRKIINAYVTKLRAGKITVNGDNLTACGNPYALLLYTVGENWEDDPTLNCEDGTIQCYTKRFMDGEYLCAIRNPHNSPNNMAFLHNVYSEEMEKYFPFSENIIAINCIHTDIQSRCNGEDWDSDFNFVTNHPTMVKCAKKCYEEYPTIVNQLKESGITYTNTLLEYARMDNKFAKSKRGIGESSNLAQLALTYYWTNPTKELYDNFIILSTLAQVIIDGCKREYEVDAITEIERIKKMDCMNVQQNGKRCDFPLFMKYTKEIPTMSNGKELPYSEIRQKRHKRNERINDDLVCPMNWLQEWLNKIQGMPQTNTTPTENFFIKMDGHASCRQMTKIRKLVEEYDGFIKYNHSRLFDDDFYSEFEKVTEQFMKNVRRVKISNISTINRLIETALCMDKDNNNPLYKKHSGAKHARRLLNTLYQMNKDKFLSNFTKG